MISVFPCLERAGAFGQSSTATQARVAWERWHASMMRWMR
jgi:hypothetical protein